jgi:hypothetical protein
VFSQNQLSSRYSRAVLNIEEIVVEYCECPVVLNPDVSLEESSNDNSDKCFRCSIPYVKTRLGDTTLDLHWKLWASAPFGMSVPLWFPTGVSFFRQLSINLSSLDPKRRILPTAETTVEFDH